MRFELYNQEHDLNVQSWKQFLRKILRHTGQMDRITIDIEIEKNQVNFHLVTPKDFSQYSNELLPFILKNTDGRKLRKIKSKFFFFNFSEKDNFIRLKERENIRKGRDLKKIVFSVLKFFFWEINIIRFYFVGKNGEVYFRRKLFFSPKYHLLAVDFSKTINYKKRTVPTYIKLQKQQELFNEDIRTGLLEVEVFPYFNRPHYFPLKNFEFDKHSLIVGQTGTGKSKFIEFFIKEMVKNKITDEYTIVVLDPHTSLYTNFTKMPSVINIDFFTNACKLFTQIGEPKIATELTILLFKTLLGEQFNAKTERVLKYTLHTLFVTGKTSLDSLRDILTEVEVRKEIVAHEAVSDNVRHFFDTDFIEMQTKYFELAVMPILTLIDEMNFLPISNFQDKDSLEDIINGNSLVFLSLSQIKLGQQVLKLIAGLLTQQIFLLSQSGRLKKKILFFIDEFSVVQNESFSAILSEARKFNLSMFLSQQYLQQVDTKILHSILTNVYNYFIFKISEDDAKVLVNNIEFDFPEEILKSAHEKGLKETDLRIKFATTLNPRECIVRVYDKGKFYPTFKGKTINMNNN